MAPVEVQVNGWIEIVLRDRRGHLVLQESGDIFMWVQPQPYSLITEELREEEKNSWRLLDPDLVLSDPEPQSPTLKRAWVPTNEFFLGRRVFKERE